jgi:hypothetical protein
MSSSFRPRADRHARKGADALERELAALVDHHVPTDEEMKRALAAVLRRRRSAAKLEQRKNAMAQFLVNRQQELDAALGAAKQCAGTDSETFRRAVTARNHGVSRFAAAKAVLEAERPGREVSRSLIATLAAEFDFFCFATPQERAQAKAFPGRIVKSGLDRGRWWKGSTFTPPQK